MTLGSFGTAEEAALCYARWAAAQGPADTPLRPPQIGSLIGRMRADSTFGSAAFRAGWHWNVPMSRGGGPP